MNLKKRIRKNTNAQSALEYVLLVGIIVVALIAMTQAIKRGTQTIIKVTGDNLGPQQNADQSFSNVTGFLESQNSQSADDRQKQILERVGIINYVQNDTSYSQMNSHTNMGFIEEQQ